MGTAKEARTAYFNNLEDWLRKAQVAQNAQALFPFYLISNYLPTTLPLSATSSANAARAPPLVIPNVVNNIGGAASSTFRILDDAAQANLIATNGGYEVTIAPFWKRAIAEAIDIVILLLLKVIITFVVIQVFDLDLGIDLDKEVLQKAIGDDDITGVLATGFLAFSSDLLMLEILTKVLVCFYEAIWTRLYGATPGKAVLNLRILYVEAVLPLQAPQQRFRINRETIKALIYPAKKPSLDRSLLRAIAKNLIMTLLFPMCLIMIFFKNNRTAYDIVTKTIVVERDANPPTFRRR